MLSAKNLRNPQKQAIKFLRDQPNALIFADPGAGKTTVVLHALKLIKPRRTLVLATKRICQYVWQQEAANWVGTKHFTFTQLAVPKPSTRINRMHEETDIHLLNYELFPWLIQTYLRDQRKTLSDWYDAIVFDEVSYMKNAGAKRFKASRNQVQDIPTRIGMTGTPIGNSLLNIWGQVFITCGEEPLGRSYSAFQKNYFESDYMGWNWTPKEGTKALINKRIKPYCYRIPVDPYRATNPINYIPLQYEIPKKLRKDYEQLRDELYLEVETTRGVFEVGGQGAVVKNKLRQMESGALYLNPEDEEQIKNKPWVKLHDEKLILMEELVESLQGKPLLVFYEFKHELKRLQEKFKQAVSIKDNGAIDRWNNNEIEILLAHPKSAGHGLNLHLGGAYHMIFFTLPWSLELWKQCIGRLNRTGQKNQVQLYYFTGPEVETQVFHSLKANRKIEEDLVSRVKSAA
ncbi:DNA/RNA helicase, superfamily II, SNF2 family [Leptolyngbya sp. PCC 7375]|nr:DNA/RNA helicase, superfamily II, SNF2 family [Leptolyngbya sp. PCC 7375]